MIAACPLLLNFVAPPPLPQPLAAPVPELLANCSLITSRTQVNGLVSHCYAAATDAATCHTEQREQHEQLLENFTSSSNYSYFNENFLQVMLARGGREGQGLRGEAGVWADYQNKRAT